jgi:hypothetical protein
MTLNLWRKGLPGIFSYIALTTVCQRVGEKPFCIGRLIMSVCTCRILFLMSSMSVSVQWYDVIRRIPRFYPEGEVEVFSRHFLKPLATWTFVMYVSISGRLGSIGHVLNYFGHI